MSRTDDIFTALESTKSTNPKHEEIIRKFVELRFAQGLSLKESSKAVGRTREGGRQLEAKFLRRMRKAGLGVPHLPKLCGFMVVES